MTNFIDQLELYGNSDYDIAANIGHHFKDYRIALRLTQAQVAKQTGISVMTLVRFENGQGQALKLKNLIALMRALQLLENISDLIPEIPDSLYHSHKAPKQRVRRKQNEQ